MTNPAPQRRRSIVLTSALAAAAICAFPAAPALASAGSESVTATVASELATALPTNTADATAVLAATPWQTTGAVGQDGNEVPLDDARAANFVGNAYFKADGTFTMFNLDDSPKMRGDWEMRIDENGDLVRWIAAKDDAGEVLLERVVPIVDLDASVFTYRVIDEADPTQWVDIVHTPTDHAEPGNEEGSGDSTAEADGQSPKNPAKQELAVTGGGGTLGAIAASAVALVSGAAVLAARAVRRRQA